MGGEYWKINVCLNTLLECTKSVPEEAASPCYIKELWMGPLFHLECLEGQNKRHLGGGREDS